MNILTTILFSYNGKIGRSDFIYGSIYGYLLTFVSLDALLQPKNWELIGSGLDNLFILQYVASVFGMMLAIWILGVVMVKRSRTLGYSDFFGIISILIPPLALVGLKKDKEAFLYNGGMSFADQIFFYAVIGILIAAIWCIYTININYKILLSLCGILAIVCVLLFSRDRDSAHTYPRQRYIGMDSFLDILFVLIIVFFIRLYLVSPFQIIGPSMETTFHGGNVIKNANGQYGDGEFILVDKMSYRLSRPKRGDVVVFSPRIGPNKKYLIKRVIGLPGDKIKISGGFVSIATDHASDNFIKIDESAYLGNNYGNTCIYQDCVGDESVVFSVPEGQYFLMGDNRPQSLDARQCFSGERDCSPSDPMHFIPRSSISGRVGYSLGHFDMFERILSIPPVLGTMKQVIPWRGKNILNSHTYSELQ